MPIFAFAINIIIMARPKPSYNKQSINPVNLDFGKVPPQALDMEEAVLGALMLEKNAVYEVLDLLKPESFYSQQHQRIFEAIVQLTENEKPIDLLTVTEQLRKNEVLEEVGGPVYITRLTNKVASAAHIDFHARVVAQKHIQRELIRVASEIQSRAFDDGIDVNDLIDFSEGELFNIAEGNIKKQTASISAVLKEAIHQIEEASKREDNLSGVPSGFTQLDRMTSGWQPSDLVIVAARPSMGKTAFVLSMSRNMAVDHGRGVAIFSLEMSSVQLVNRLIVGETGISSEKIRNGNLQDFEWQMLEHKVKVLEDAPIYIDDTPGISIFELRAKLRRLMRQQTIDIVIIDYLQLMTGTPETRGNREQEVSTISRALKSIAKEMNVPVIALSQLNRSVEVRGGDKRPQLSDLRESGAIEQDADMVTFIHRPEKYGFLEDENGNSLEGLAYIILAKHRNGAIGDVVLRFKAEQAKFSDLEDSDLPPIDDLDDTNAVQSFTVGSKMNQEPDKDDFGNNDLGFNNNFGDDVPF